MDYFQDFYFNRDDFLQRQAELDGKKYGSRMYTRPTQLCFYYMRRSLKSDTKVKAGFKRMEQLKKFLCFTLQFIPVPGTCLQKDFSTLSQWTKFS